MLNIDTAVPAEYAASLNNDALVSYRAILDHAPLGICFTIRRQFAHCNQQFCEMLGWHAVVLLGQSTDLVYPASPSGNGLGNLFADAHDRGERIEREIEIRRRDGSTFWARVRANKVDDDDPGKGMIFIVENISARKQADEINRRHLLEYQSILDNASLGITFVRKRKFTRCNARFDEMFGWPAGELVGRSLAVCTTSEQVFNEISADVNAHLSEGRKYESERQMMRRDGSVFWCRMLAKMVDPDDPQKGSIFITEDISQRKIAQDELEARVRARTAELAATNARLELEIAERRHMEEQIRHLADHDVLTNLPNRRLLHLRLEHALLSAKRSGNLVGVFFVDLDHFKPINDNFGHRVGDLLLQDVAQRLASSVREVDTVARVGGDEFVLLLPDLHVRDDARKIAERIMQKIAPPCEIDGHVLQISLSIGIGLYPQDCHDADSLLSCADTAMYRAKENGRNNYRLFDEESRSAAAPEGRHGG